MHTEINIKFEADEILAILSEPQNTRRLEQLCEVLKHAYSACNISADGRANLGRDGWDGSPEQRFLNDVETTSNFNKFLFDNYQHESHREALAFIVNNITVENSNLRKVLVSLISKSSDNQVRKELSSYLEEYVERQVHFILPNCLASPHNIENDSPHMYVETGELVYQLVRDELKYCAENSVAEYRFTDILFRGSLLEDGRVIVKTSADKETGETKIELIDCGFDETKKTLLENSEIENSWIETYLETENAKAMIAIAEKQAELAKLPAKYIDAWHKSILPTDLVEKAEGAMSRLAMKVPPRLLQSVLPSFELRPILAAEVVVELDNFLDYDIRRSKYQRADLLKASPVLQILELPYKQLDYNVALPYVDDLKNDGDSLLKFFTERGGINSTFRNLLLASYQERYLFAGSKNMHCNINMANYTWQQLYQNTFAYSAPDILNGRLEALRPKLVISFVDTEGNVQAYADYGKPEGEEEYGSFATGEGFSINSANPTEVRTSMSENKRICQYLETIANSQEQLQDAGVARTLRDHDYLHRYLVDFVSTKTGLRFPSIISGTDSFNDIQLGSVLKWATLFGDQLVLDLKVDLGAEPNVVLGQNIIFTTLQGQTVVRIESEQPSTRTVTASEASACSLGLPSQTAVNTSAKKGEDLISDAVTLIAHDIGIVMQRSDHFEKDAEVLGSLNDSGPIRISLGGLENHPSQTLAELKALMRDYGCQDYSIEEFYEKTKAEPFLITFVSNASTKRADKALARYISKTFPHCQVRMLVSDSDFTPDIQGENVEIRVVPNLQDQKVLLENIQGSRFLYTSNAYATSKVKGKDDSSLLAKFRKFISPATKTKKAPSYFISAEVVEACGCKFLHPLPASDEIERSLLTHPQSLIVEVMKNKIFILSSMQVHAWYAKKARLRLMGGAFEG